MGGTLFTCLLASITVLYVIDVYIKRASEKEPNE